MNPRTRLALLTGAALLSTSWLAAGGGVATAGTAVLSCDGLAITIQVPMPGMVTNGGGGADVINGTNGPDVINGLGGNDHICGNGGNDDITGGNGNDRLFGNGGDDRISGDHEDDDMFGGAGDDLLNGGPHNQGDRGDGGPHVVADNCVATEILARCNP
jgi:Ca2+-binding RTX toxin-like protein